MARWPTVALGEVAPVHRRPVETSPEGSYLQVAARSFGRGSFRKPILNGDEITWQNLFQVRAGDLLFSNIKAWEGAVAVISQDDDGLFCSHRYITCVADQCRALPSFLGWFFRTPRAVWALGAASPGSADRNRTLSISALKAIRVPLPPLEEQRRIVARLDRIQRLVSEALELRKTIRDEYERLSRDIVYAKPERTIPLRQVLRKREHDISVIPDVIYPFAGVYSFGRGVFAAGSKPGSQTSYKVLARIMPGQLIYPKLMAWEGALGIVPERCGGRFVSPEFCVFDCDTSIILPEVLGVVFRDPSIWSSLRGTSKGTNVRRQRLNPGTFLEITVPVPSMQTQVFVKSMYERRDREMNAISGDNELEALLPAMLHEIFGEAEA